MLHFEKAAPASVGDGATVLVLLHGRGSHERDLLDLGGALDSEAVVITPRAPFPGQPWGYGPGWAWYRYLGGNRPEPESFTAALADLDEFVRALPELLGFKPGKIVLGGFSQGGTMSTAYALSNRGAVAGVLNFSGFVPDHPSIPTEAGSGEGVRVFWGHGTGDESIPFSMAEEGRATLEALGVDLEAHDYPIGHWIAPEELQAAANWLRSL